jgi:DNA-binding XRE family transcriptional regulator
VVTVEASPEAGVGTRAGRVVSLMPVLGDPRATVGLLEALLKHSGLSQAELARRLNVKRATVQQYKSGLRPGPSMKTVCAWAAACHARVVVELLEP